MKVGYIQFNPVFGEKGRNVKTILKLLDEGVQQGSDLIVLPELCNTGYVFRSKKELKSLSEDVPEGETTEVLATFAREKRVYVVAGVCEREKGKYYNSAILVGPTGFMGVYRKAHLFNREKIYFSMGDSQFIVYDVSKAKIGIMICFDWFFPEVIRILALKGAHLICHPANLVLPYCQTALLGAAIQNKIFIITANRIGVERGVRFTGGSQILNPNMKILSKSGKSEEVKVIEIDIKQAENKKITEYNDLWSDRRLDLFHPLITWGENP
ncbi:acyltransferase [Candidatus Bathyarchaeota archaeon]|nr:acyltransferase [Candidatus Bathyarchaeota archaeon]